MGKYGEDVILETVTEVMFLNANLLAAIGVSGKVYYSMANGYNSFKEVSFANSVSLPYKEIIFPDDDLSILFLDQNDKIFYWRYPFPDMIDTGILWNPNCILNSLTLFDSRPKYFCTNGNEIWTQDSTFSQASRKGITCLGSNQVIKCSAGWGFDGCNSTETE